MQMFPQSLGSGVSKQEDDYWNYLFIYEKKLQFLPGIWKNSKRKVNYDNANFHNRGYESLLWSKVKLIIL